MADKNTGGELRLALDGLYGEASSQKTTVLARDDDVSIHPLIETWVSGACSEAGLPEVLILNELLRNGAIDAMLLKSFNPGHLRVAIVQAIRRRAGLLKTGRAEPAEVSENF